MVEFWDRIVFMSFGHLLQIFWGPRKRKTIRSRDGGVGMEVGLFQQSTTHVLLVVGVGVGQGRRR